jgi:MoaA/NifB/PqqE/SkfB family radical SAM enzyme
MNKKLISRVFDFYITTHCTLNCELCMTSLPYIQEKYRYHISFDSLARQLEEFFEIYNYANRLEYMGGEPLMHPNFAEIIRETLKYADKFGELRITTNATIMPNDELCELIANCGKHFDFVVDDYGPLSKNIEAVAKKLEAFGIPCRIDTYTGENQHFGGWIKCGDYEYIDYTDEELRAQHRECVQTKDAFACVYEGKVFQCPYPLGFYLRKDILPPKEDYIDLFDETMSREEKRAIALEFYKTPMWACHRCFGFEEKTSKRYPAALQVPRKWIEQ